MLQRIEKAEQRGHCLVVLALIAGSRYRVNPFCEVARNSLIQGVDLTPQGLRIEIELMVAADLVEGIIEHFRDLQRFVADDPARLPVPKHRDQYLSGVIGTR